MGETSAERWTAAAYQREDALLSTRYCFLRSLLAYQVSSLCVVSCRRPPVRFFCLSYPPCRCPIPTEQRPLAHDCFVPPSSVLHTEATAALSRRSSWCRMCRRPPSTTRPGRAGILDFLPVAQSGTSQHHPAPPRKPYCRRRCIYIYIYIRRRPETTGDRPAVPSRPPSRPSAVASSRGRRLLPLVSK